jgi:hypothetical protein
VGRQLFCLVGVCALCPAEYGHGTNANALKPAHPPQAARANEWQVCGGDVGPMCGGMAVTQNLL